MKNIEEVFLCNASAWVDFTYNKNKKTSISYIKSILYFEVLAFKLSNNQEDNSRK